MGATGGLDAMQDHVAHVEVSAMYVSVVVAPGLLFVPGVLSARNNAVLFDRVDVLAPSCFSLTFFIVLDARGTEGNVTRKDGLRTVD
jgi:hypothetical protein